MMRMVTIIIMSLTVLMRENDLSMMVNDIEKGQNCMIEHGKGDA